MSNLIGWLKNGTKFIVSEFIGQIVAAVILIAAYVAWVHFSSGFAAIAVIVISVTVWVFVVNTFRKSENKK